MTDIIAAYMWGETNQFLHVYNSYNDPYFNIDEIGVMLKVKNIQDKIKEINPNWVNKKTSSCIGYHVNEPALYKIIMTIKPKEHVSNFTKWICDCVLPDIRTKRNPEHELRLQELIRYNQELRLNTYERIFNVFVKMGLTEEDVVMFKEYGKTLMSTDCKESLNYWTTKCRIIEMHNIIPTLNEQKFINRKITKCYSEVTGDNTKGICIYDEDFWFSYGDDIIKSFYGQKISNKRYLNKKTEKSNSS